MSASHLIGLGLVVVPSAFDKAAGVKADAPGLTAEQLANRERDGLPGKYHVILGRTNLGLRSGVVDVETDVDKETGELVGEASLTAAGIVMPPGPWMQTDSGSKHRPLRLDVPDGMEVNFGAKLLHKVDVPWQFLAVDEDRRVWHDLHLPIPHAPEALRALVLRPAREHHIADPGEWAGEGDGTRAAVLHLAELCERLRDAAIVGGWNDQLNMTAFIAGQLVASGTLDADYARETIFGAMDDPDEKAALDTFESGWNSGLANPRKLSEDMPLVVLIDETPEAPEFPVDALPAELARVVVEGSRSICCPPDYIGAAGLAILGSAIGGGTELAVTRDWRERPALWVAIVGEPGARKTPALKPLLKPVFAQQKKLFDTAAVQRKGEKEAAEAEKRKPNRTKTARVHVDDTTVEALCMILEENPGGVLMHADELAGWVRGMGQYKGGLGRDRQHWLSMWAGSPLMVDRKGADIPVYVPSPFVAVVGGIQPDVLSDVAANRDDGLLERLLLARGDAVPVVLTQESISQAALMDYEALWQRLRDQTAFGGETVRMDAEAWETFEAWHNVTMREMDAGSTMLRGVWAKMPAQCARIALILNRCTPRQGSVDGETMGRAVLLAEYFKGQIRAVLMGQENSTPAEKEYAARLDKLVEWCGNHPGATERDILRAGPKWARKKAVLEQALADLRGAGRL